MSCQRVHQAPSSSVLVCIVVFVMFALSACTTVTTSYGRPFDALKVGEIQRGITTVEVVIEWFGQPITKSVFGSDGEIWVYHDTAIDTKMQDFGVARDVKQKTQMRRLELFIRNGIVENHTYTEGPI